jgi:hypothetical protein
MNELNTNFFKAIIDHRDQEFHHKSIFTILRKKVEILIEIPKAGSTLAANSRGIKWILTPTGLICLQQMTRFFSWRQKPFDAA